MAATIVVETGVVISGANSYVTTAELATFADERGVTITAAETEDLLIQAMDWLEMQNFKGLKGTKAQPLQWPRSGVAIDKVYWIDTNEIPEDLKKAEMQIALSIDSGYGPQRISARNVKRQKVDVIEVEYADKTRSLATDPKVKHWLKKLIDGFGYLEVIR